MGGFLYPYIDGTAGWAFTDKTSAGKILKKVQSTDGVGLVMVQAPSGIIGSNSFQEYAIKEIENAVEKGVDPKFFIDRANEILKGQFKNKPMTDYMSKQGLPTEVNSIAEFKTLLPYTGNNKASYEARGNFYNKLFNAKTEKEADIPRFDFGANTKKKINQYGGITMTELVNDPALKGQEYGDIVSAIQFDKESSVIDSREDSSIKTHPSYPFVIKGEPIMVFNQGYDVRSVFPDYKAQPTKEQPSPQPLKTKGKPQAARSAMGGQPATKLADVTPEETITLFQKVTPKKITKAEVDEALSKDKTAQKIIAKNVKVNTGDKVGVRLNLNVLKTTGVPVQTVHRGGASDSYKKADGVVGFFKGEAIKYDAAVTLKDAYFNTHQKSIYEVKNGIKNKFPLASVDGLYQDIDLESQDLTGAEIRFNPMNTQLFETLDGKPVKYAEEATMVGNRVFARGKIEFYNEDNKPKPFAPSKVSLQRVKKKSDIFEDEFKKHVEANLKLTETKIPAKKEVVNKLTKAFVDRQYGIKNVARKLDQSVTSTAKNFLSKLITKAGASSYANNTVKGFMKDTFDGLKTDGKVLLSKFIMARRVVAINEDKGSDTAYRLGKIDKAVADSFLEQQKEVLGQEKYNDFISRSDAYFDHMKEVLEMLYKGERISADTYKKFKDVDYVPINVIREIAFGDENSAPMYDSKKISQYGLAQNAIKALTEANEYEIFVNAEYLMKVHTTASIQKIAINDVVSTFADMVAENNLPIATTDSKVALEKGYEKIVYYKDGEPQTLFVDSQTCLLYTSPSPRDS